MSHPPKAEGETRPRRGRLREKQREAIRASLLEAVAEIVDEVGEEGLTVQRIAERVECSVGSVYRHFPSREAIIDAYRATRVHALRDHLREQAARDDQHRATRRAGRYSAELERIVGHAHHLAQASATHGPELQLALMELVTPSAERRSSSEFAQSAARLPHDLLTSLEDAAAVGVLDDRDLWPVAVALTVATAAPALATDAATETRQLSRAIALACLEACGADPRSLALAASAAWPTNNGGADAPSPE